MRMHSSPLDAVTYPNARIAHFLPFPKSFSTSDLRLSVFFGSDGSHTPCSGSRLPSSASPKSGQRHQADQDYVQSLPAATVSARLP